MNLPSSLKTHCVILTVLLINEIKQQQKQQTLIRREKVAVEKREMPKLWHKELLCFILQRFKKLYNLAQNKITNQLALNTDKLQNNNNTNNINNQTATKLIKIRIETKLQHQNRSSPSHA